MVVPGTAFLVGRASVGDIVNTVIRNDNTEVGSDPESVIDQNKSGHHLIHSIRHTFRETTHEVTMSICKLERKGSKESKLAGRGAREKNKVKGRKTFLRGERIV